MTSPRSFFDPDSPETRAEWVFAPPSEFGSPARNQSSHRRTETKPFPPIRPPRALTTTLSLLGVSQYRKRVFGLVWKIPPSVLHYISRALASEWRTVHVYAIYQTTTTGLTGDCCSLWRVSTRERETERERERENAWSEADCTSGTICLWLQQYEGQNVSVSLEFSFWLSVYNYFCPFHFFN